MPFQITGQQYEQLRDAILAAFSESDFSNFLLFKLNVDYDALSSGPNYQAKIVSILKYVVKKDKLAEFVTNAAAQNPNDPTLKQLVTELTAFTPPSGVDPYEVCCLSGSHIMVNRAPLRTALRDHLCNPSGKRILVIKGSAQSGKSHTLQLLAYLQTTIRKFTLVHVDLEECIQMAQSGSLLNAEDLAAYIIGQMDGYEQILPPAPSDGQRSRWVIQFCSGLEKRARTDTTQWWIALDGFNKVSLPQPTLDLIKALANRVNLTLDNFRIVLIGYGETFASSVLPNVIEEQILALGPKELWEFFDKAFTERKLGWKNKNDEEKKKDLTDAVGTVFRQVDQTKPGYMSELSMTASRELNNRLSGGDGNPPRSPS
jgi:hypothetical protein